MTRTHRRFGVEQEHFILHADGTAPTHREMDAFYEMLVAQGFRIGAVDAGGRILAVERHAPPGATIVTNDCCTNVLEVAFPPLDDWQVQRQLYLDTFAMINAALAKLGLQVRAGSAINPTGEIFLRPKAGDPAGQRLQAILNRPPLNHPLFHPALPACIAATHVSLNVPESDAIARLPGYYAFEPLVPLLFGNSPEFNGVRGHCVRPLAWMVNFPSSYGLLGIPERIPQSLVEYEELRRTSQLRDYSFVAIRGADRLEFRSACSQNTIEDILLLIRFRLAVDRACEPGRIPRIESPRQKFIQACTNGPGDWCQSMFAIVASIDPALESLAQRTLTRRASEGVSSGKQ